MPGEDQGTNLYVLESVNHVATLGNCGDDVDAAWVAILLSHDNMESTSCNLKQHCPHRSASGECSGGVNPEAMLI